MRYKIKELARDLLIQHGYRGVSFGDVAKALGTTRANIHYHFGNKESLVEEVLEDYVRVTSTQLQAIWTKADTAFADKIKATVEYSRKRHLKYNPRGRAGNPWSLIARMRQDSDALSARGCAALQDFGDDLFANIVTAIEQAKSRDEFDVSMPAEDIALQLVSIANSAGSITQAARSFDRLEQLYMAFLRIMTHAYGKSRGRVPGEGRVTAAAARTPVVRSSPARMRARKVS
jgi:AcrR family transcriptional regulator